jgi:hypothetical protein
MPTGLLQQLVVRANPGAPARRRALDVLAEVVALKGFAGRRQTQRDVLPGSSGARCHINLQLPGSRCSRWFQAAAIPCANRRPADAERVGLFAVRAVKPCGTRVGYQAMRAGCEMFRSSVSPPIQSAGRMHQAVVADGVALRQACKMRSGPLAGGATQRPISTEVKIEFGVQHRLASLKAMVLQAARQPGQTRFNRLKRAVLR